MTESNDILASRLNFDVIVFRGHTRREMLWIGLMSLSITALILSILTKWLLGMLLIGVGLSFPLSIAIGWCFATILQKMKENKPKGFLKQKLQLWLEDKGIKKSPFVRYSGQWSIHRRMNTK